MRFLAQVRAEPALRQMIVGTPTADEVSLLAQERGFLVSGRTSCTLTANRGLLVPGVEAGSPPVGHRCRHLSWER